VTAGPTTDPRLQPSSATGAPTGAAVDERDGTGDEGPAVLRAVRALLPEIAGRAEEIEAARRLPVDLVARLRSAGVFRMGVPARLGGDEVDLHTAASVLRSLARADGSVAWTAMIGASAPLILGMLPPATLDEIYAGGPDVVLAGAFNPSGMASPTDGGYRVNGRWAFASGCQHADWFVAHCIVDDGRMPPVRMVVLPPSDVEIADTWWASGLCGTGSHHFGVRDAFVPDARTFALGDPSNLGGPAARVPELAITTLLIANVATGIAEGALDECRATSMTKTPAFTADVLAASPTFQRDLAESDAQLRAARATLDCEVAGLQADALAGRDIGLAQRARVRATATWATAAAVAVVDRCYRSSGGSAVYSSGSAQRRFRDVHALAQHFSVGPDTLTLAGAVLAGREVDDTFL
jgi:alkylation response protein AidB-like acyl-CoA dehydrogenase